MKAQPSNFEATRTSMHVLTSKGITGINVALRLREGTIPPHLLPHVRLVHGKNAGVRKALARINQKS